MSQAPSRLAAGAAAVWLCAAGGRPGAVAAAEPVTFTEHVAPIVFQHCTSCHRPGEAAPFSLQTYADVRSRGRLIAAVTAARQMPPWKAGPGDYAFRNARTLTAEQIDVFQRWVAAGMPEGDARHLPAPPTFADGWALGPPDLVVSMAEPFAVPADGPDIYRNFVVPLGLERDAWVRAVDFRPSARTVVHHSLFFLDATGAARQRDAEDPGPGFDGSMGAGARGLGFGRGLAALGGGRGGRGGRGGGLGSDAADLPAVGSLGGWALGAQARELPDGLAFFVPQGADLVLSTHFHPSGKVEREQSVVALYFADGPPAASFTAVQLPPLFGVFAGIDIPAGEPRHAISDSFVLPVAVRAFGVGAHAHYLGREMTLTATLPDRSTKTLLSIPDWDFAWQEQYQFDSFVDLPAGTRLDVTITYDNSADNPRNPSRPPARVTWGEESTDEMGSMTLLVVPADPAEMPTLRLGYAQHLRQALFSSQGLRRLLELRQPGPRGR